MNDDAFLISTSRIGAAEKVSSETVRRIVRKLEDKGEIKVERSPTGRAHLTVDGYARVRDALQRPGQAAA